MFKIDEPNKGEIYLKQKLEKLHEELDTTSDLGAQKKDYRINRKRLRNRIIDDYAKFFKVETKWLDDHLHKLNMVGDMMISDTEYQESKPVYKSLCEIKKQFNTYVDFKTTLVSELNFSESLYNDLHTNILKNKGKQVRTDILDQDEIVAFNHERAIETLIKIHKLSLTTYKDRIYYEAFGKALDYSPMSRNEPAPDKSRSDRKKVGRKRKQIFTKLKAKEILKEKIHSGSNKRFIHQAGRFKGKPNWRQLRLYYFNNYPENEDKISERVVEDRFKEAYAEIISTTQ